MEEMLGNEMHYFHGKKQVNIWGKEIFCFGADDESAEGKIRGMTVAGAYQDEITLSPASYFKTTLGRMSPVGAKYFGTTNPDSPFHWLKTDFFDRIEIEKLDMNVFHFELDDNLFLTDEYKNNLKKEYTGLFYKRFIEGLWCQAEGAVYDFFNETFHVKQPHELPQIKSRVIGVDYGTGNPTAFICMARNPETKPKIWAEKEYFWDSRTKNRQKTDDEYANDFLDFISGNDNIEGVYIDPSAASFILALKVKAALRGVPMPIREADNSVLDGIRTQSRLLKNGEYTISSNCPQTIKDYYAYSWDTKAQQRGEDKPLKQNDHTKDAERYSLYTIFGKSKIDYDKYLTY
jgi:PBSX family phage terminase large subunit